MPNQGVSARNSVDPAGEFPFAPEDYVLHLLTSLATFREAALDNALKNLGLTMARFRALSVLVRCGDCTMTELAGFTAVDRTTLTRIADQLVAAGFAERVETPKDRRQVVMRITEEGAARYRAGALQIRVHNAAVTEGLPPAAMRGLSRSLVRILENATPSEALRAAVIRYRRDAS
jgi:DNA-binding MarR family transcriptional regulator